MKELWNTAQVIFAAIGGWLGYFLGGCDRVAHRPSGVRGGGLSHWRDMRCLGQEVVQRGGF